LTGPPTGLKPIQTVFFQGSLRRQYPGSLRAWMTPITSVRSSSTNVR
jgi:hypothetical protein